jgi:ABC-type multidrug transport system ATPase subunit
LISSHLLSEVEKMATHFGIIHKGRLLFQGSRDALLKFSSESQRIELETTNNEKAAALLGDRFLVRNINDSVLQVSSVGKEQIPTLSAFLMKENIGIYKIGVLANNLEDIFIEMVSS